MAYRLRGERGFSALLLPCGFGLPCGARRSAAVAMRTLLFRKYENSAKRDFHVSERSRVADALSLAPGARPSHQLFMERAPAIREARKTSGNENHQRRRRPIRRRASRMPVDKRARA